MRISLVPTWLQEFEKEAGYMPKQEGITNQEKLRGAFADKILIRHKMTRDEALWEALAYLKFLQSEGLRIITYRECGHCKGKRFTDSVGNGNSTVCQVCLGDGSIQSVERLI